jgi:hypothetical protein
MQSCMNRSFYRALQPSILRSIDCLPAPSGYMCAVSYLVVQLELPINRCGGICRFQLLLYVVASSAARLRQQTVHGASRTSLSILMIAPPRHFRYSAATKEPCITSQSWCQTSGAGVPIKLPHYGQKSIRRPCPPMYRSSRNTQSQLLRHDVPAPRYRHR